MKKLEIKKNTYYDSVLLMLITRDIKAIDGIDNAIVCMATNHNKELLESIGFKDNIICECNPNDLIIAIDGNEASMSKAISTINDTATRKKAVLSSRVSYKTLKKGIENNENSNLVIISTPGEFVYNEAKTALLYGKNVMIFSDNVPIEDEIMLKKIAKEKGLLVMGPDCGTAIINNKPLCFANKVLPGNIGIVGASGTGIQEVTSILSKHGCGISQAIGTGSKDLSKEVAGITMEMGIDLLADDPKTEVIVLISKPPHPEIAYKIVNKARTVNKKFVINFLGESRTSLDNVEFTSTLENTALMASSIVLKREVSPQILNELLPDVSNFKIGTKQKYVRGLFVGGTLCYEALLIARNEIGDIYSNLSLKNINKTDTPLSSYKNTFIDLGDDIFTKGKPHPMIDPETRNRRIIQESKDPHVAVILLDFVLGYGSHHDPVGITIPYIQQAKANNPNLIFVVSVTGTKQDPQNFDNQCQMLLDNGIMLASCNAQAAKLAALIVKEINK